MYSASAPVNGCQWLGAQGPSNLVCRELRNQVTGFAMRPALDPKRATHLLQSCDGAADTFRGHTLRKVKQRRKYLHVKHDWLPPLCYYQVLIAASLAPTREEGYTDARCDAERRIIDLRELLSGKRRKLSMHMRIGVRRRARRTGVGGRTGHRVAQLAMYMHPASLEEVVGGV